MPIDISVCIMCVVGPTGNSSLEVKLEEIRNAVAFPKEKTTKYRNSKISASDSRVSATAIGYVCGVAILVAVVGVIVLSDAVNISRHMFYRPKYPRAEKF